jgi:3-oxoacyl-[acyl-carrier protein] reductase
MNLGLAGKRAIVCAASRGLGRACAMALASEGVEVTITGRTEADLETTAKDITRETGAKIHIAVGDITTQAGRAAALVACADPDILINNAGGPPPGDFRSFTDDMWHDALNANMLSPIAMIKAVIDPMIARKFGRIINITSGSVKSPIAALGLSNGARTGLTGFIAGLSRDAAKHNVIINNLLPGPFNTDRLKSLAKAAGRTLEDEIAHRSTLIPARRVGEPDEFGAACAFLCSAQAGFIVGQNILLDGGLFNSTM